MAGVAEKAFEKQDISLRFIIWELIHKGCHVYQLPEGLAEVLRQ